MEFTRGQQTIRLTRCVSSSSSKFLLVPVMVFQFGGETGPWESETWRPMWMPLSPTHTVIR